MHICSVITSFTTGGAETLVCNLARSFVEAGHQASVISLAPAQALGNSPESERKMMGRLRAEGIFATSLGLDGRRSTLKGAWTLRRCLGARLPDVLHLHTARAALMAGLAGTSVPIVLTHHNSRLSFSPHLYKLFDRFVFAYVGISSDCAAQTRRHAHRPVRLIFNGAELSGASSAARAAPAEHPTIVAVGTISDQKDYPALIAAAKRLRTRLEGAKRSFTLQIVGGGEQLSHLRELVEAEDLGSHIQLLGVRNDISELLRRADLFVNSSRYEGLSIATIEALMSALPVIATDVPGNKELVLPGKNGLLVAPGDPDAFASAIASVFLSRPLYAQLSKGALASSEAFTLQRCAQEHLKLYEEAITFGSTRRHAA